VFVDHADLTFRGFAPSRLSRFNQAERDTKTRKHESAKDYESRIASSSGGPLSLAVGFVALALK
jgi:hypothetical protein